MRSLFGLLLMQLVSLPAVAEDQVLVLLKELKGQVQALQEQAAQANNRIHALEDELQKIRGQQAAAPQATGPAKAAVGNLNSSAAGTEMNAAKPVDKPAVTVGDIKGTFKIPGTDTSLGLGGYVKTDLLFSSVSAGHDRLGDQQLSYAQIPVGGTAGEHSQMTLHAKESRLWFKSFTPSQWGDINTFIEMDFFGDPATYTYTPRLRHGYGAIGNLLAGQTWTTFLHVPAVPEHLEVGGSAGSIFLFRQPQVRWSQPFNWHDTAMEWQMAIESPRSRIWAENNPAANGTVANADNFFTNPNADRYPDLVTRLVANPDWGSLALAALGRQIRYTDASGLQRELWGGGINLAGRIDTLGLDNIRFMVHYGNGAARYTATNNTFSDAALRLDGTMELSATYGGMLSYQHWWDKYWRSTLTYGITQAEQAEFINPVMTRQVQSLHANLLWSPVNQAMLGLEYTYSSRELIDNRDGELQRVQFSARYSF